MVQPLRIDRHPHADPTAYREDLMSTCMAMKGESDTPKTAR